MCCAVLYNVEMLELLKQLRADDPSWTQEANLLRLAIKRDDPDVQVLDWLFQHLLQGDLGIIKWFHQRKNDISGAAMDVAAKQEHIHVLRYFYEQSERRCSSAAIEIADIVKFAFENQKQPILQLERVISAAALHGYFELVRYFVESGVSFRMALVVDSAAVAGHLEILKYLIHNFADCCTDCAMFCAGEKGHLDVLKFLHEHRTEKCSPRTLTRTAANGHLEVVKFLHETCGLSIFSYDLSAAAESGHLEVVKFVHQHCPERCTAKTLKDAASKGHLGVIKFLCEYRTEGNIVSVLFGAICDRNLKVVEVLLGYRKAEQSLYGMMKSIAVGSKWLKREIVAFLCKNQECEPASFLMQAVAKRSGCVAELVILHATLDELVSAKEHVLKLNDFQMVEIIAHGILRKTSLPIGE